MKSLPKLEHSQCLWPLAVMGAWWNKIAVVMVLAVTNVAFLSEILNYCRTLNVRDLLFLDFATFNFHESGCS
jgi:hypothetical protein